MLIAPRQSSPSRPSTLAPGRHLTTCSGSDMNANSSSGCASTEISFAKRMRQTIVYPPLTDRVWPVMYDARSEASSSTGPTMSSGVPSRRSG